MADDLNTSFFERRLKMVIQLYKGEFEDGSNTKEITDLAMTCQIKKISPAGRRQGIRGDYRPAALGHGTAYHSRF